MNPNALLANTLILAALAAPASSQNLVTNGDFDDDVTAWEFFGGPPAGAAKSWSAVDSQGAPTSGSALLTVASAAQSVGAVLTQCVPVEAGRSYQLTGKALVPSGQARTGYALMGTTWWALPGCLGVAITAPDHFVTVVPTGSWQARSDTKTAPAGAVAALVRFGGLKTQAGGSFAAHFDGLQLTPAACVGGDGWLTSPDFPGFRFRVGITPAGQPSFHGTRVTDCMPGALCISGALPNRTEIILRLIGPRPNGYLWLQAVRLTASQLAIEAEQVATATCRAYELAAIPPDEDRLDGVVDRVAFLP